MTDPVGVVVGDTGAVGLGVAVALGVGFFVGVTALVGVSDAEGVAITTGVGETKMILMAPSSGTGDTVLLPARSTPMTIRISARTPMIIVTAAIVFLRSSIRSSVALENKRIKLQ